MISTLPTYEKQFYNLKHSVPEAENIYLGHFRAIGTRDGRFLTAAPVSKPVVDRFKSWHQLEYTLPPSIKDRRC
jgi:hypothetical protein